MIYPFLATVSCLNRCLKSGVHFIFTPGVAARAAQGFQACTQLRVFASQQQAADCVAALVGVQVVLPKAPTKKTPASQTERPKLLCRCCGAAMAIVRRRILPVITSPTRANREEVAST
jgi:hypothetical protein